MKLRMIAIDGYGRFTQRVLELSPGLQVVLGPNEQGKTTLRNFIADMLFGQKRSPFQRLYDDGNELRRPWDAPDVYGGRLTYQLDDGREFEVHRQFDRNNESVQIFDLTNARDVTGEFDQLRNREPLFALKHLGISKEIFLNTATIGHSTLDGLGDAEALAQLREKLLTLADTGEQNSSADAALRQLESRIGRIGQPNARTRPLPAARNRYVDLKQECEEARARKHELSQLDEERRARHDEIARVRAELAEVEAELAAAERAERRRRLREAEALAARIDDATRRCFELHGAERFPLDEVQEFQRSETLFATARQQLERLRHESDAKRRELGPELERLTRDARPESADISEEYDQQLMAIDEKVREARARLEQAETARAGAFERLRAAETELAALPDYSLLANDPISWLNQLASSFRVAVRYRDEECEKRRRYRERVAKQQAALADMERVFSRYPDFEQAARDYEVNIRMQEEQLVQLETSVEVLHLAVTDHSARIPGFVRLSILSGLLLIGLLAAAVWSGNKGIYIPAGLTLVAIAYFVSSLIHARVVTADMQKQLQETEARIVELHSTENPQNKLVEDMMVEAQCQTIRELEARYDYYQKGRMELAAITQAEDDIEGRAAEAEQRVAQLFKRYRETFQHLGEDIQSEAAVEEAAGRAVARYQSFRDAKRRIAENREQVKRHEADIAELQAALEGYRRENVELGLRLRQMMRNNGYLDESRHDSVLSALRSYRIRSAQLREQHRLLTQTLGDIEQKVLAEEEQVAAYAEARDGLLARAGAATEAEFYERAKQAEEYHELRRHLEGLNAQVNAVLRGQELAELRAAVAEDGEAPGAEDNGAPAEPGVSQDDLRRRRGLLARDVEALIAEEHAVQLAITQKMAGVRPLNEIEEELARVEAQIAHLEFEIEAASYSMALIEEIARGKHACVAPRLAARAGAYIKDITGGAYEEVLINRELQVSVRVPQLQRLLDEPERVLSKGAIDQLYFALRLALVQVLGENGETIPIFLDDPFPNYDDKRLENAMLLLAEIGERNQVLLFTCRHDVAAAASAIGAPMIQL